MKLTLVALAFVVVLSLFLFALFYRQGVESMALATRETAKILADPAMRASLGIRDGVSETSPLHGEGADWVGCEVEASVHVGVAGVMTVKAVGWPCLISPEGILAFPLVLSRHQLKITERYFTPTPTAESFRVADEFYTSLAEEDYEAIHRLCGPEMFQDRSWETMAEALEKNHRELGPLESRVRKDVSTSTIVGQGADGVETTIWFNCRYRNAATLEALRVFEPRDGGSWVRFYRVDVKDPTVAPDQWRRAF